MKHIIYGGDGFVGSHLADRLNKEGETVIVTDIVKSNHAHYKQGVEFVTLDVTRPEDFDKVEIRPEDALYNMSAMMLSPIVTRAERYDFFWPVNYFGTENLLKAMEKAGAKNLVHFTTDMIYGHTVINPMTEEHPVAPIGEYGESKLATEKLADEYRKKGFNISLFRPRLIIGPGRLGILEKLFKLIDYNLPVPMIGTGKNPYQFISVFDCAEAARLAWKKGFPNEAYNLGSENPPSVRKLLGDLIKEANSWSILLPTPAPLVKLTLNTLDWLNMPIMDPEQYMIADEVCILDCAKAERDLGWKAGYRDEDMLKAAYREYRAGIDGKEARTKPASTVEPA